MPQFAEKIHAYTLPRGEHTNTRVKDLVDLVLLLNMGLPDTDVVRRALHATFTRRATHEVPLRLPSPPDAWRPHHASDPRWRDAEAGWRAPRERLM